MSFYRVPQAVFFVLMLLTLVLALCGNGKPQDISMNAALSMICGLYARESERA